MFFSNLLTTPGDVVALRNKFRNAVSSPLHGVNITVHGCDRSKGEEYLSYLLVCVFIYVYMYTYMYINI